MAQAGGEHSKITNISIQFWLTCILGQFQAISVVLVMLCSAIQSQRHLIPFGSCHALLLLMLNRICENSQRQNQPMQNIFKQAISQVGLIKNGVQFAEHVCHCCLLFLEGPSLAGKPSGTKSHTSRTHHNVESRRIRSSPPNSVD